MRRFVIVSSVSAALVLGLLYLNLPSGQGDDKPPAPKPSGLDKRVPWETSQVRGSPEPPSPYKVEVAFPKLKFDEPLDMGRLPDSKRLFVVERFGRVLTFPNDPQADKADLMLDLSQHLGRSAPKTVAAYGFAAHPQWTKNGYVFVTYVIDLEKEVPDGTRLSRFKVSGDPPKLEPKSETILLEWPCGGHNGGHIMFGPDGHLYVATGDASGIADAYLTGQDLNTLAGKILRIDVDKPDAGKTYGVPKDNPFVDVPGARPEIWAYGMRQPWKISFDGKTGDLWCGNVGQDLWEQIYKIERGGNYGWSVFEGSQPFRPERPRGPSPILMPVVEHDHANFRSITGGFVYHGTRLKDLTGDYVYGDYDTGKIWAFRYDRDKKTVSNLRELVDSTLRLVGFGEDASDELFLLDHLSGRVSRLVVNPAAGTKDVFPRKLSETGLFASTKEHKLSPGVLPFSVIAPQWLDGATAERFFGLPGNTKIEFETVTYPQPAPGSYPGWRFPTGAVLGQTVFLETEPGNPASRKRVETRLLQVERVEGTEEMGDQVWQGYTYVWNDDQSDAVLLEDPMGRDRTFTLKDKNAAGGERKQTWHFPSRAECNVCHHPSGKYALGLTTLQANRDHDYGGVVANQLRTFEHIGLFTKPLPTPPEEMPRLVDDRDEKQDLNLRARSYLHANCSHCHRKWGGGNAEFQLLATLDLAETGTVGVRPGQGTFNIPGAKVIAPHDPYRSMVYYRMAKVGPGRMPRIGSNVVDEAGVKLIHDWIGRMPGTGLVGDAAGRDAERSRKMVEQLRDGGEDLPKRLDALLASPTATLRLMQALGDGGFPAKVRDAVVAKATASEAAETRDLFEKFLPEEKRVKRLGDVVRPQQILALPGDAERGRKLFFEANGVQCRNCHRIGGKGVEVGPDLDGIAKKYDRAAILDNIMTPSKQVEAKYLTYLVTTAKGQVYTGLLVSRDANKVVLKDANNKLVEVAAGDVETVTPQQKSLMPDLLLRDFTAEQVADLTTFLGSLK